MIFLNTISPNYIMSNNPNPNNYHLYDKIDENENSSLYKIDFRTLIIKIGNWSYNRPLKKEIIDDLYKNIKNNNINWILSAVKEKDNDDNIYLIDGQHRLEAIKKIIEEDIDMKINKYVYVTIYSVDNIDEDFDYINELFIKINSNTPLEKFEFPSTFTAKLIKEIIKDPVLSIGISINPKTHSAHQPMIHKKTLNEILNISHSVIKGIDINTIVNNLKFANNRLSIMKFEKIYFNCNKIDNEKNKSNWNKAKELGFYLGLKDCCMKYKLINLINNINKVHQLFKD